VGILNRDLTDLNYASTAPKKPTVTIQTDSSSPNPKSIPGNSVNEHKQLELANALLAENEIGQQNENL
jgi:hypothetical protein